MTECKRFSLKGTLKIQFKKWLKSTKESKMCKCKRKLYRLILNPTKNLCRMTHGHQRELRLYKITLKIYLCHDHQQMTSSNELIFLTHF